MFSPVLDCKVQCERMQLALRHCGEFIPTNRQERALQHHPALKSQAGTAICQRYRNMQSSLYLLPDLPSEGFSLCQSCTLHGFALAALGCFCFCGWFGMGESFIAAAKDWYLGAYGWTSWSQWEFLVSNRGRTGRWILFIFQRFSCYRSPSAEISLQKSVSWEKQV